MLHCIVVGMKHRMLRCIVVGIKHTSLLAGLSRYSVLDKIVPAYYHRLEDDGSICGSAFGANNAREIPCCHFSK